jgi:hypothetical protein
MTTSELLSKLTGRVYSGRLDFGDWYLCLRYFDQHSPPGRELLSNKYEEHIGLLNAIVMGVKTEIDEGIL